MENQTIHQPGTNPSSINNAIAEIVDNAILLIKAIDAASALIETGGVGNDLESENFVFERPVIRNKTIDLVMDKLLHRVDYATKFIFRF